MLIQKIRTSIREHGLIARGEHLLAGVSGGADSVAMLHALAALREPIGFRLSVAHLNHHIRPEAEEDAHFVESLCGGLGIPFTGSVVDVPARAAEPGVSLEMAARAARYQFFAEAAATLGADAVATAHTQDDQAETVLLKLCRGAGSAGLDGIARSSMIQGIRVVRPLLDVSRTEIEHFLQEEQIQWREDATNADTAFKRNCVRHDILPLLAQQLNPRIKEALARTAAILSGENALLEQLTTEALRPAIKEDGSLAVAELRQMPPALQRRALQQWLLQMGASAAQMRFDLVERVVSLAASESGSGSVSLSAVHRVQREYARLRVVANSADDDRIPETLITVPGETLLEATGLRIIATQRTGFDRIVPGPVGQLPAQACIRWDFEVPPEIHVRSWQPGDRIGPFGMDGSRKLQDLLVDAKLPRHERAHIPVFVCRDEIVWLPGYRISRNWAVLDEKQHSLQLRVEAQ